MKCRRCATDQADPVCTPCREPGRALVDCGCRVECRPGLDGQIDHRIHFCRDHTLGYALIARGEIPSGA